MTGFHIPQTPNPNPTIREKQLLSLIRHASVGDLERFHHADQRQIQVSVDELITDLKTIVEKHQIDNLIQLQALIQGEPTLVRLAKKQNLLIPAILDGSLTKVKFLCKNFQQSKEMIQEASRKTQELISGLGEYAKGLPKGVNIPHEIKNFGNALARIAKYLQKYL